MKHIEMVFDMDYAYEKKTKAVIRVPLLSAAEWIILLIAPTLMLVVIVVLIVLMCVMLSRIKYVFQRKTNYYVIFAGKKVYCPDHGGVPCSAIVTSVGCGVKLEVKYAGAGDTVVHLLSNSACHRAAS